MNLKYIKIKLNERYNNSYSVIHEVMITKSYYIEENQCDLVQHKQN